MDSGQCPELKNIVVRSTISNYRYNVIVKFATLNGMKTGFGMTYPASRHGLDRAIRARTFLIGLRDGDEPWTPLSAWEKLRTFYPFTYQGGTAGVYGYTRDETALFEKLQCIHKVRKVLAELMTEKPNLDQEHYSFMGAEWAKGWVAAAAPGPAGTGLTDSDTS